MALFSGYIRLDIPVVIEADDEDHAWDIARDDLREILSESPLTSIMKTDIRGEVQNVSQLPEDWDDQCIPYGGDGNTRIAEILGRIEGEGDGE